MKPHANELQCCCQSLLHNVYIWLFSKMEFQCLGRLCLC
ncbi:hypothetical protein JOB18_020749 [Solea senegalensis]|uniref:Uncharacterized protein n=1 Tax=Solea senegalensis TaxID=28829 RepID=A0AAV6RYV7_SOLSE|nr:hypothetical protein JOB18_020749 [Solea senegalensis]